MGTYLVQFWKAVCSFLVSLGELSVSKYHLHNAKLGHNNIPFTNNFLWRRCCCKNYWTAKFDFQICLLEYIYLRNVLQRQMLTKFSVFCQDSYKGEPFRILKEITYSNFDVICILSVSRFVWVYLSLASCTNKTLKQEWIKYDFIANENDYCVFNVLFLYTLLIQNRKHFYHIKGFSLSYL